MDKFVLSIVRTIHITKYKEGKMMEETARRVSKEAASMCQIRRIFKSQAVTLKAKTQPDRKNT